ncbi:GspE/PulE family protein [bacterium]|nr:GspE/PulE family protein [bacterium]
MTNETKKTVSGYAIDPESVRLLPQLFCYSASVVVLGEVDPYGDEAVTVGVAEPDNLSTLDTIYRKFAPRRIVPFRLTRDEVNKALNIAYGIYTPDPANDPNLSGLLDARQPTDTPEDERVQAGSGRPAEPRGNAIEGLEPVGGSGSAVVEIVNNVLLDALKRGATDVHIENERKRVKVRYKLDGLLHKVDTQLNKDNIDEVINRLKVMANLDISERRSPQDGRVLLRTIRAGRDYDVPYRISVLPGPFGEEIVLRILDKSMAPISLELLGFTSQDLKTYRRLIHNPQGMILVTGPTGSGKTTTLYASLKEINSPHNKILSAEDPIEYNIEGVSQKQITAKFGFADMARAFLRHDPDILLIGEIRDEDTADVACKAAQTGHLILSTLHTNDSIGAISRLGVLGLDHELIGSSLLGVLSQRLVRRICPHCREEYTPDDEVIEQFLDEAPAPPYVRGRGCEFCSYTGFRGRIGVFELFIVDDEIQRMIYAEVPLDEVHEAVMRGGMAPLVFDGLRKVEQRFTTLDELVRVLPMRQIASQIKRHSRYKKGPRPVAVS